MTTELLKELIAKHLFSNGTFNSRYWRNIQKYPGLKPLLEYKGDFLAEKVFRVFNPESGKCIHCGKDTEFIDYPNGFRRFCSSSCASTNSETIAKSRQTTFKKYGTSNYWDIPSVKENISKAIILAKAKKSKELKLSMLKNKGYEPVDINEFHKNFDGARTEIMWKHNLCGNSFKRQFNRVKNFICPFCHTSNIHSQVLFEITDLIEVKNNDRKILGGKEIDLFIPSKNIGFEINGTYWHSGREDSDFAKVELAKTHGIKLISVSEHDLIHKKEQTLSRIKSLISEKQKVGGRSVNIELNVSAKQFLDTYHMQGSLNGKTAVAKFKDQIIAALVVGKARFGDRSKTEIYRWCVHPEFQIIGGLQKMLKSLKVDDCVTYCDIAWSPIPEDTVYARNGFILKGKTKPGYVWVKKHEILNRYQTQKSNLETILGEKYDSTKTEKQNMEDAGWIQVMNFGSWIFEKINRS